MHPIHDIDVLLLLATTLSSKRRPSELVEILAAVDFIQSAMPTEAKLRDAFARLARNGLVSEVEDGFALTPDALKIVDFPSRKGEPAERLFSIKEKLAGYTPASEHPAIALTEEQVRNAIAAHQALKSSAGKNLLMPKPKPADDKKPPSRPWHKPWPAKRRKN